MTDYSWTVKSAIRQVTYGELDTAKTENAENWLYSVIAREAQAQHPLMTGVIAGMILDALIKLRESTG